jgi:hypothetical protein
MDRMNALEIVLPGLAGTNYRVTSPPDDDYNCIAWAATETDRWWWPDPLGAGYWPNGITRAETQEAFVTAYATVGFVPAADDSLQPGVEKIAVYAKGGKPTHAARQLPSADGRASSVEPRTSSMTCPL